MPQRPKQTDDTTGSPCSPSDTFGRGIVRLLGDRRNLGRFRAIAGQWRATFSGSPRDSPRLHCSHNCHPLYKCPQGTFFIWGQSPRNLGTILARSPRAGRPGCLPQRSRAGLFCGRAQYGPPAGRKGRNLFPVLFVNAGPADGSKFEPIEQFFHIFPVFSFGNYQTNRTNNNIALLAQTVEVSKVGTAGKEDRPSRSPQRRRPQRRKHRI